MSEKVAKRHNFPTNNRKIQIKLANGQVTMGRCTEQLLVEIQGKCSDLSFVILPQENIEIIIGLDWLTVHNAIIHSKEGILEFKDDLK